MSEIPTINFEPKAMEMAIKLAAFDIMKQARKEGLVTEEELKYLANKHNILIEK